MGKKGKKYPAHQIARKNFLMTRKLPSPPPPTPTASIKKHMVEHVHVMQLRTATSSCDSILDMTSEY